MASGPPTPRWCSASMPRWYSRRSNRPRKRWLRSAAGRGGRVRVGAFPTAGSSLVPQALAAFQQHLPDVALDLTVLEPDEAIASLHAGTIDVAVVVETFPPGQAPSDGLRRRHLLADPFRMVIPRGHRLAARRCGRP